ncbi:hypothetical protein [Actinomadura mexicana]|nr:hypothetical protein [Actinomadura mexicana]
MWRWHTHYEGLHHTGRPTTVMVRGRIVIDNGTLTDPTPQGRHLKATLA